MRSPNSGPTLVNGLMRARGNDVVITHGAPGYWQRFTVSVGLTPLILCALAFGATDLTVAVWDWRLHVVFRDFVDGSVWLLDDWFVAGFDAD